MVDSSVEDKQEDSEDELRQKFINKMTASKYSKSLAIKALEIIKPDQIVEGKFVFSPICLYKTRS